MASALVYAYNCACERNVSSLNCVIEDPYIVLEYIVEFVG